MKAAAESTRTDGHHKPEDGRANTSLLSTSACFDALRPIWPEIADKGEVHQSRICWYAETSNDGQDLDSHPAFSNFICSERDATWKRHPTRRLWFSGPATSGSILGNRWRCDAAPYNVVLDGIRYTCWTGYGTRLLSIASRASPASTRGSPQSTARTTHLREEAVRWAGWKPD
ncbi:hypothetical protein CF327_g6373 [Tilletia walkeri]|nr:hypothetical protein CF327_g6373 [Tilletia walkeri]